MLEQPRVCIYGCSHSCHVLILLQFFVHPHQPFRDASSIRCARQSVSVTPKSLFCVRISVFTSRVPDDHPRSGTHPLSVSLFDCLSVHSFVVPIVCNLLGREQPLTASILPVARAQMDSGENLPSLLPLLANLLRSRAHVRRHPL